tara:strand:- start:1654 stop:1833 length:180 start_codon:yes stop_codon:yes gene_type:complete
MTKPSTFTVRELEIIQHALKVYASDVETISKKHDYTEYMNEINNIQTKIEDVIPTYTLN